MEFGAFGRSSSRLRGSSTSRAVPTRVRRVADSSSPRQEVEVRVLKVRARDQKDPRWSPYPTPGRPRSREPEAENATRLRAAQARAQDPPQGGLGTVSEGTDSQESGSQVMSQIIHATFEDGVLSHVPLPFHP